MTRTNLAYANDHRDLRVFAAITSVLMRRAQRLYMDIPPELGLEANLFALDATVIELSLALLPWARWKQTLASVKLNVLLDSHGDIPVFAGLHEWKRHEVASLDELLVQPGSYYVMDRGYLDFSRLHRLHQAGAYFVTRLKTNTAYLLVAIAMRRLHLSQSLWEILQIVSIASLEQTPLPELLATIDTRY